MSALTNLSASLVLLCLPSAWWLRGRFRRATVSQILDRAALRLGTLHPLCLLDLPRAWAGVWLLEKAIALALPDGGRGHILIVGLVAVATSLGLILQLLFHRLEEIEVHPPGFYLTGLLLGSLEPAVAVPALFLGIATSVAVRNLMSGLIVTGLSVAVLGVLFGMSKYDLATQALYFAAILAPVIGSNRHYAIPISNALYLNTLKKPDRFSSRLR